MVSAGMRWLPRNAPAGTQFGAGSGAILALLASGAVALRGFREAHLRPLAVYSLPDARSKNAQIGGD